MADLDDIDRRIVATLQAEGRLPIVQGNESLLTQCFSNLIGNALTHGREGSAIQVRLNGEAAAKEAGKMRLEGKDYVVKDGDVMHFRFAN